MRSLLSGKVNKLILEILPIIDQVVEHTTKDYNDRHEIKQTLILKLYSKKKEVKRLHKEGNLLNWLYIVCRNINIDLHRARKNVSLVVEVPDEGIEDNILDDMDRVKTLPEMLNALGHVERLWMDAYIENGMSYRAVKRKTNVCRAKVKERIETILEEWKHLDIYLPQ